MAFNQNKFNRIIDELVKLNVGLIKLGAKAALDMDRYHELNQLQLNLYSDLEDSISTLPAYQQAEVRGDLALIKCLAPAMAIHHGDIELGERPVVNWLATFLMRSARFWQGRGVARALDTKSSVNVMVNREWPYRS